jgi:hypothetical protein
MIIVTRPKSGRSGTPMIIEIDIKSITPESEREKFLQILREAPEKLNKIPMVPWNIRITDL